MRFSAILHVLAAAACALAQSGTLDAYVASESAISRAGVFANIGPSGSKSSGAVRSLPHMPFPTSPLTHVCYSKPAW